MSIIARKKINKTKRNMVLLTTLILLILMVGWLIINSLFGPYNPKDTKFYNVSIKPGVSTSTIAQILVKEQIIGNPSIFEIYVRLKNLDGKLKAGDYTLSPSMSVEEIVKKLLKGQIMTYKFTIPEGYTLKEIAETLKNKGLIDEKEFWRVVEEADFSDFEFTKDLPKNERRLEGYLFPDTYIVPKGISEKEIIHLMLERFAEIYAQLPPNRTSLTPREVVILASMVELESAVDKDRTLIASVFLNRLEIGMKLDCDATLQYIFPERKKRVLYSDLEIDSPYNTYKYKGLPPGPIGSPGKASLEAVHQPAETNYLYFVARKDGSGEHVFASTHKQHINNKRKLGY